MLGIKVNKYPTGKVSSFIFGFIYLAHSLVVILSMGYLRTDWAINHARWIARRHINKTRE